MQTLAAVPALTLAPQIANAAELDDEPLLAAGRTSSVSPWPTQSSIDWDGLCGRIGKAKDRLKESLESVEEATAAMQKWDKRNPFPTPEYSSVAEHISDHEAQCQREADWCVRKQNAMRQSGRAARVKARDEATHELQLVLQDAARVEVINLDDLCNQSQIALMVGTTRLLTAVAVNVLRLEQKQAYDF